MKLSLRSVVLLAVLLVVVGLGYAIRIEVPIRAPRLENTLTPQTRPTAQEIGSYDILGRTVSKAEAEALGQTSVGRAQLAAENGAIAITPELIAPGRDAFYRETFGNEVLFTDVLGAISGPINLVSVGKAIAALKGKPTTNLQITLDQEVRIGDRVFPSGSKVNTGLDVATGSLIPLGMQTVKTGAKIRVGLTCALCHASVEQETGRVLEGAPNVNLDSGLLQAFATNSAAMFRQTGVQPTTIAVGDRTYINAAGQEAKLPDAQALETAVDNQLLSWLPGNFDSTGDNANNPAQNPSSYTFETYPYGWSGFASVGWFHGLTTLNNNVHATNSDPTTGANSSQKLLGIDKETYLGVLLQNAADRKFRLPNGAKPSEFLQTVDPTPGEPALNEVIKMPGFPQGSIFVLDGLMASSPGLPVAKQINALSAYQNTLAPPPRPQVDRAVLERGAKVFEQANCAQCHSGRYFTNHQVISETEIQSQSSRAVALAKFPRVFTSPQTYPPNVRVPLPTDPPVLDVPTEIAPQEVRDRAYAIGDSSGGYKVQNLIGLYLSAPYLHDGGVAASAAALQPNSDGFYSVTNDEIGAAGTVQRWIPPDPAASLRVLLDRTLREAAIAANRASPDLQAIQVDGSGHHYWVDRAAGFSSQDQTDLIQFLLSIDDDPAILPASAPAPARVAIVPELPNSKE